MIQLRFKSPRGNDRGTVYRFCQIFKIVTTRKCEALWDTVTALPRDAFYCYVQAMLMYISNYLKITARHSFAL